VTHPSDASAASAPDLAEGLFCPECGYDLRGTTSDRCPECGLAIDRAAMSVSRIPWVHRRRIGRFRAYWRTVRLVTFKPRQLVDEMNRPIRLSDARRFWLITVFLAWIPIAAWPVAGAWNEVDASSFLTPGVRLGWLLEAGVFLIFLLAIWLFLLLATGSLSNWFHSRSLTAARQERALALSYYACAPLAWMWLPSLLATFWLGAGDLRLRGLMEQIELIGLIAPEVLIVILFLRTGVGAIWLMRKVTQCGAGRTAAMWVGLPLSWGLLLFVLALLPLAATLVSLAILSFR
jgi:hypothetical protein